MTCTRAGRKQLWTLLVLVNVAVILSRLNTDQFQFRHLNSEETYKALHFVFCLLEGLVINPLLGYSSKQDMWAVMTFMIARSHRQK